MGVNLLSGFNEEMLEDYVVEKFQEFGWKFIPAKELNRDGYNEPLLNRNLTRAVKCINASKNLEDIEIIQAIKELKLKPSSPDGIKQVLYFLKNGVTIRSKRGRGITNIKLFDYHRLVNNEYIVTRQAVYHGVGEIRTDIILYVNGIPLVNIELKNPASFSETWLDAYHQIKDYEKSVPELYKYVQIGVAAEQNAIYFPIVPNLDDVKKSEWRENSSDPIDAVIRMLSRERILDLIRNYVFIREEMGMISKAITRYMQYHASEKIVDRVIAKIEGRDVKKNGLIWHWQGSGKTLTMIFAANKLYQLKEMENPSIFFIVDRIDLKDQLYQEFTGLDAIKPEIIRNIDELKRIIQYDDYKGKRGVFITLIHKFRPEELEELSTSLKKLTVMKKDNISTRENVVTFIDEAHRTQYGNLAAQMKRILGGGFFFAFTGTPIAKKEKDTYMEFAYLPEEKYLDRYFITDSIKDGFTLKIVYQPRLEKDIHLNKKMIEAFAQVEFEELPDEIQDDVEVKVKEKLNPINLFLENPERIIIVAKDVAQNFTENVDGRFKAMVVAASRKACVHYKRELDKLLPPEFSEIVMTYTRKDDPIIKEYRSELEQRFHGMDVKEINKEIIEKFKENDGSPKILIVKDMLLTGFDAPILQTMYLDQPLKEHRLLQAVARTNRPYKDVKEAGYILDYIGIIKEELERALENYSKEEIEHVMYDMESIKKDFTQLMDETLALFEDVPRKKYDRETFLRAIEILTANNENSEKFNENYLNIRRLFEFLGTESIRLERLDEYKWITAIYVYYKKMVTRDPVLDETVRKYFKKTIKFVHKTTEFEEFQKDLPVIEFDENYLENLERKIDNEEQKAANIVFALNKLVLVKKQRDPVYESVADKVERVLELWKTRTKDYEKINQLGKAIIKEIFASSKRKKELELTDMEYAVLNVLEERFESSEEFKEDVKELSYILGGDIFEGWIEQRSVHRKIEGSVRRFLRKKYYKRFDMNQEKFEELFQLIMSKVENYAE
jgi:type I restriction enzyme R subunit